LEVTTHSQQYLIEVSAIAAQVIPDAIERLVFELGALRNRRGRLFIVGLGGSAANAAHMVNDMRKLCQIEAYAPTDNVSELTARANDEGWGAIFSDWLQFSNSNDALFVLSVGGGKAGVSVPIVNAVDTAKQKGMMVFGIVGRDGGYTKEHGDHVIVIPVVKESRVTPHTESFQAVIWHCIVSHPDLQKKETKW
jgi:D-sedoheptulose 7-phosphate isomerase